MLYENSQVREAFVPVANSGGIVLPAYIRDVMCKYRHVHTTDMAWEGQALVCLRANEPVGKAVEFEGYEFLVLGEAEFKSCPADIRQPQGPQAWAGRTGFGIFVRSSLLVCATGERIALARSSYGDVYVVVSADGASVRMASQVEREALRGKMLQTAVSDFLSDRASRAKLSAILKMVD